MSAPLVHVQCSEGTHWFSVGVSKYPVSLLLELYGTEICTEYTPLWLPGRGNATFMTLRKLSFLQVFDYDLQRQLIPYMKDIKPLPGIYDPNFIAANQAARADNLIPGTKAEQVSAVREQLKQFKSDNSLDKIIVLWTANTERYSEIKQGLNDTEGETCNTQFHG